MGGVQVLVCILRTHINLRRRTQNLAYVRSPSKDEIERLRIFWVRASSNHLGPGVPEALEIIPWLRGWGCVRAGHTAASYDGHGGHRRQVIMAHIFNAMGPLHHGIRTWWAVLGSLK